MKRLYIISLTLLIFLTGCESLVDIDAPEFQLEAENVFQNESTADAAMQGIYSQINRGSSPTIYEHIAFTEPLSVVSDEMIDLFGLYNSFDQFQIQVDNSSVNSAWDNLYAVINMSNAVIEGVENASYEKAEQLKGEALFMRSLMYFYLVNLYGDVPLIVGTDVAVNSKEPRTSVDMVYERVTNDLLDAFVLLPEDYSHANGQTARPNKWAVATLLARIYLYRENWGSAEEWASKVIASQRYALVDTQQSFKGNSEEAIFQILPDPERGNFIALSFSPQGPYFRVSDNLLSEYEESDSRLVWFSPVGDGTFKPNKYTQFLNTSNPLEWFTYMRFAELYLIRAEARARQNNIPGSQADINAIRNRAGIGNTLASTSEALLEAVRDERYKELWMENHRWFDLKRWGLVRETLVNGVDTYEDTDLLWPIPSSELSVNTNLTQNPGYN